MVGALQAALVRLGRTPSTIADRDADRNRGALSYRVAPNTSLNRVQPQPRPVLHAHAQGLYSPATTASVARHSRAASASSRASSLPGFTAQLSK